MIPANQAEAIILDQVIPLTVDETETLSLLNAQGRILAEDVRSHLDFPHWDNSAMDGYAVRYDDVKDCTSDQPVSLAIVEEIPAGVQPQTEIQTGQCARIFTGAILPAGADTIVMQENATRQDDTVSILEAPNPQSFVRHKAAFYQAGHSLLKAGTLLTAPDIAVLAAAQCATVTVYRRPRVAILSTGDELVPIDQPLQAGQIVDSNRYALAALITAAGAEPVALGIVPDQPDKLKEAIAHALSTADIVLSSGGVSVGDYDYVDQILAELGATIHIRAVAVKPGKPLTVATVETKSEVRSQKLEVRTPQLPNSSTPQLPNSSTPQLPNSPTPQLPNLAQGSARSARNINLYDLVKGQAHLLHRFGGHPFAAGLSIEVNNIPLFRDSINQACRTQYGDLTKADQIPPKADLTITVVELGQDLFRELKLLEPCGMGNPVPRLLIQNCDFKGRSHRNIKDFKGGKLRYIKTDFQICDRTCPSGFPGTWWGHYQDELPETPCDAIVELDFNSYNRRYEIRLLDLHPSTSPISTQPAAKSLNILDQRPNAPTPPRPNPPTPQRPNVPTPQRPNAPHPHPLPPHLG